MAKKYFKKPAGFVDPENPAQLPARRMAESEEAPAPEEWPSVSATRVPFSEIRRHLPAETGLVSPQQRREQIQLRQRHVQRRYRAF